MIPDEDVDLHLWREKHADHFSTNEHVSVSKFQEFWGTRDLGMRLHIPAAGKEREADRRKTEAAAQAKRCRAMRGEVKNG